MNKIIPVVFSSWIFIPLYFKFSYAPSLNFMNIPKYRIIQLFKQCLETQKLPTGCQILVFQRNIYSHIVYQPLRKTKILALVNMQRNNYTLKTMVELSFRF